MNSTPVEPARRPLVVIATYNEIENLPQLVDEIFQYGGDVDILVIDDNSPDGTGRWCAERAQHEPRLHCLHRSGKLGLGTATLAGFAWALDRGYPAVCTMDADFSHPPRSLPDLLRPVLAGDVDVMIGSRYVSGGAIEGWPWQRRLMSRCVNWYARWLLAISVRDCSGAFRCYRSDVLRALDFRTFRSRGYSYLEEILWRLQQRGARFGETPITFVDRQRGKTKINWQEAFAALWVIFRLGVFSRAK